jgi:hypothetical protein
MKSMLPRLVSVLIFSVMAVGCATPNVQPFADATVELRRAVVEGGAVTADSMARAARVNPNPSANNDVEAFASVWQDRVKLMDVLVAYSDSIANIALAGRGAKQTAEALGDSVASLADLVPATGIAVNEGLKLGELLVKTGIEIKTYHDLDRAVNAAHDALEKVATYLKKDIADLKRLYVKASQDIQGQLEDEFGAREGYRRKLLKKRDELRQQLPDQFTDANIASLEQIEELLAHVAPEHLEYMNRRADLFRKRATTIQLFDTAQQGVAAWSQSHKALKQAIDQNRRPNVRLIMATAQEIKDAVDRVQNP